MDGEYVKLVGDAYSKENKLRAPISGRECLWYQVIAEARSSGKNSQWEELVSETKGVDFIIQVTDQRAYVPASDFESSRIVQLTTDYRVGTNSRKKTSIEMERFLGKHGISTVTSQWWEDKVNYRFLEGIIAENERIVVKGIAQWEAQEGSTGETSNKSLKLVGSANNKLIISDLYRAKSKMFSPLDRE